ncbi:MAG: OB-fold domain-containing protein [Acidimicrobiales bacterium]|nr:OB-fold domain-containing protein [Acidimicrobiales bacterium]
MSEESAREVSVASDCLPIVDYLQLGEDPHLVANECTNCGARYFDRRNACAKCGKVEFAQVRIADEAVLKAFSVVHRAAPGIPVPYVSAIVETGDGTSVRANVLGLADPMDANLGMHLRFSVYSCGLDDNGTECVAFGYTVV